MLSEEEKTTLESIKTNNKHKYCGKDDVDFLLNLIKKQQKEIEELKDEYNTKLLCNAGIYQLGFKDGENSIENKIKAKIEEVQKRLKEETRTDFLIILKILENELQSLLEKEENQ
jgi:hypothetical protein